jgi:hypothetical protein
MQRYTLFLKNKINLLKNDKILFLNEMEWEVSYSQNTGLFGALRLKDLPIIQINPYGVFFDFIRLAQTLFRLRLHDFAPARHNQCNIASALAYSQNSPISRLFTFVHQHVTD